MAEISGIMSDEDADLAAEATAQMADLGSPPQQDPVNPIAGLTEEQEAVTADLASSAKQKNKGFKVTIEFGGKQVVFEASTPVSESRSSNYEGFNIVHLPSDIWAYRNTSARRFSVAGKFISRTPAEAETNAYYLNLIRKWILPDFGATGATPPIVRFSAYRNGNIDKLPCIIRSYAWTFPDDVDFIFANLPEPMPVIGTLQIDLDEAYTAEEITAGAWRMHELSVQKQFEGGQTLKSSSNILGLNGGPNYKWRGVATGLFGIPGLPSIGGILNKTVGPILKVLTGGRSPGTVMNAGAGGAFGAGINLSPQISEQFSQMPGIINNPFSGGLVDSTLPATSAPAPDFVPFEADSFGREGSLEAPSFTEV